MGKKQIEGYIKEYIERLKKDVKPEKVILYGSYLTGKYKEGSDIDLVVISNYFSNMDEDERLEILYRKTVRIPLDFHLYGLTPKETQKINPLTSLFLSLKEGKKVELYPSKAYGLLYTGR